MPENIEFKNAASTASLIVTKNGEGLYLVKRKHNPFKGMWALPGGFLNCDEESLEEAAIRELKEETSLSTTIEELLLIGVNSDPQRDPRGHVIDHVYLVLDYHGKPQAKDDAEEIKYFEYNNLPEVAFDHKKSIDKYFNHFHMFGEKIKKILFNNNIEK